MRSSRSLVSFVTRAENRVDVLLSLAVEPRRRPDLQTDTDISRATLSRILADFRARDIATRDGHEYRLTALGGVLASELESVFDAVEEIRSLQAVSRWLPLDNLGADLAELSNVDVTLPTPVDPMAPVKRAAAVVGDVEHVRAFCYSVVHAPILAEARAVTRNGQRFEAVIAADVLKVVAADPELAEPARELFESGNVELSVYEGDIEPQLIIAGPTTMLLVTDEAGAIQGLVEIDDEAMLPKAERLFESIKRDADPIASEAAADLLTS